MFFVYHVTASLCFSVVCQNQLLMDYPVSVSKKIFRGRHHLQFVTQREWPLSSTKCRGVRKGKLVFPEIRLWEGESLRDQDNRENSQIRTKNAQIRTKTQQLASFLLCFCSGVTERVEQWVYHWEQRWRQDTWEKREKRKIHVSVERNICVPMLCSVLKMISASADKKQKTFSTEKGWFSVDQLLNFSVNFC